MANLDIDDIPEKKGDLTPEQQKNALSVENHKKQHDLRILASSLITGEQSLVNNRVTWMMTFQGLLFASFALTASKTNDEAIKIVIIDLIPYVGFLVALFTLFGVIGAFLSITKIKKSLKIKVEELGYHLEDSLIPYSNLIATVFGRATAISFPVIIALTWLVIISRVQMITPINTENVKTRILVENDSVHIDSSKISPAKVFSHRVEVNKRTN